MNNYSIPSPRYLRRTIALLLLLLVGLLPVAAQVTTFVDNFSGPTLNPPWSVVYAPGQVGFNGNGQYVANGVYGADSGLTRSMGGQGPFVARVDVVLSKFVLGGSCGTQTDFKFRFMGNHFVEVVFNSCTQLRVYSSQLGSNFGGPVNLSFFADGDTLNLLLSYDGTNAVDVKYALNNNTNAWQELGSATGIANDFYTTSSDLVLFKWGANSTNLPQMELDNYQVTPAVASAPSNSTLQVAISRAGINQYNLQWNSLFEKTYSILSATNLSVAGWQNIVSNVLATPPTNSSLLVRPPNAFEAFSVMQEGPLHWPQTDYCAMLSHNIQGREHAFLAGNVVYYIGGQYSLWNLQENETIGLTHPFFHDGRCRGHGMVSDPTTGYGHDLQGWEFYRDTKIAYGTVIIGANQYPNPVPQSMYWRPDRVICNYSVGGVSIQEMKFISTNDVVCSIITASSPIKIKFSGQSYFSPGYGVQNTATCSYDAANNAVHVVEGGTATVHPTETATSVGVINYNGMSTVVSASTNFGASYSQSTDGSNRQLYTFTVPCDANGVSLCWTMDDVYTNAVTRVQAVLSDPAGQLAAKKVKINTLLNTQIPYFRCSDTNMVTVYYYLWSLYLMYFTDVEKGWENHPHTQTAVNNFLGMHRFDANFQIRVGAWVANKDQYAYGNVLIWSNLLPYAHSGGQLPDNMGQSWLSPYWETAIEHVVGAWEIYKHTGDTNFLNSCYTPFYKPLFWNGANDIWGAVYDGGDRLQKMAVATGNSADVAHWQQIISLSTNGWLNPQWQQNGVTNYFAGSGPTTFDWTGMAYMRNDYFPENWAQLMTGYWAADSTRGFFGTVPLTTRALVNWASVDPNFASAPDANYFCLIGMYRHHAGTNANVCALGHILNYNYNSQWGIPVAPESYDHNFRVWGDEYSNFNAGKLLLFLEGMAGLDYSVPDGYFTVSENMPSQWSYMELKVPVIQSGQTNWIDVLVNRTQTNGNIQKTVTVTGNPFATLNIQPWLEQRNLSSAPAGYTNSPTGHIGYTFSGTASNSVTIIYNYIFAHK